MLSFTDCCQVFFTITHRSNYKIIDGDCSHMAVQCKLILKLTCICYITNLTI